MPLARLLLPLLCVLTALAVAAPASAATCTPQITGSNDPQGGTSR